MKQKDLIFDVGLHRGEDTDFYLRKGFRVVAFEADPEHVEFCRARFKEFIERGQLKIVEGAIVDFAEIQPNAGKVSFYKNESNSVWGTTRGDWAERWEKLGASIRLIEVDAIDFLVILKQHGIPHYLKIDIEGCDLICVKALKEFQELPDYISLESDKTSFAKIRNEINLLSDLGYRAFQAIEQSSVVSQRAPSPAKEGHYIGQHFELGASGLFGAELADTWRSPTQILRRYRIIRAGYWLLGENGILTKWKFRGAGYIRLCVEYVLRGFIRADVPGWYDTHARLDSGAS